MSVKIAIDGPAASGKGTLAKTLAMALTFDYLDTGTLYRAVALHALEAGFDRDITDETHQALAKIARDLVLPITNDSALRTPAIAQMASKMAVIPEVREALVETQRRFAANPPSGKGAVLDGRDIGTVILPDASLKLYIDANIEVRAQRRFLELSVKDDSISKAQVLADLTERDARDKSRDTAPLKPAEDAYLIDTSEKTAEEVLTIALDLAKRL